MNLSRLSFISVVAVLLGAFCAPIIAEANDSKQKVRPECPLPNRNNCPNE